MLKQERILDVDAHDNLSKPFLEAAGNTFYILYEEKLSKPSKIKEESERIFKENLSFDTLLYVARIQDNQFKYLVIERDGSWSEMCGNGARAVAKFLYDNQYVPLEEEIVLITNSNKSVVVKSLQKEGQTYYDVDMGQVTNSHTDRQAFRQYLSKNFHDNLENISEIINGEFIKYLQNPELLYQIYPDYLETTTEEKTTKWNPLSNYDSYFFSLLKRINQEERDEKEFLEFVNSLKFRGLYQAAGEPHTLLEITNTNLKNKFGQTKFTVFLKLVSFLLRYSQTNGQPNYPLSMNFMFFEVLESESQKRVLMYPAERGVHNGIHYDQTGACGTGSTCLGVYLGKDPRFTGQKEIAIENRSGVTLFIKVNSDEAHLIGQAEKTDLSKKEPSIPFTVEFLLEKFRYYNPNGEKDLDLLSKQTENTELSIFRKIRKIFGSLAVSIDHPNPNDFFDWYTLVGYLNTAYIANILKIPLCRTSLDTTGTKGKDYPTNSNFSHLKIPPNLPLKKDSLEGWNKESTVYSFLIDLIGKGIPSVESLLKKIKSKNLKKYIAERYNNDLFKWLENTIAKSLIYSVQDISTANLSVKETVFLNVFKKAIRDFFSKVQELIETGVLSLEGEKIVGLPEATLINLFQNFLKGRLNEVIYKIVLNPEQKNLLKQAKILDQQENYIIPNLQSLDAINKTYKEALLLILNEKADLLTDYLQYVLAKSEKKELDNLLAIDGQLVLFTADQGWMYRGETITIDRLKDLITEAKHFSVYGLIFFIFVTLGQLHHFGSERGLRQLFLEFLLERYSQNPELKELLQAIRYSTLGLICSDYNPEDYNPSCKIPPNFPIATDNSDSGNPFLDFFEQGTRKIYEIFQQLVYDPNRKPLTRQNLNK